MLPDPEGWEVGRWGMLREILQVPTQWSTLKNLENSALVLGTFWGHKTQSSQATPVLHYPPFQGKDTPVPGNNQRYKHSVNLTRNQRQQKAECKQNQLQVSTTSMNSLILFFDSCGKREKITQPTDSTWAWRNNKTSVYALHKNRCINNPNYLK